MGLTKTEEFTAEQNAIASIAKAIGHPARVAILEYLISSKTCITGNIVDQLPLSQSTVSQHLKELKSVGLIKGSIEGTSVCYCINEEVWEKSSNRLNQLFNHFQIENNCC
ncbi:MAG: transcriptional regulator [Crocinitomicaceae bacterium]|nr:transcriptional regulator [Crocinitomicaceae bacterium]|tara:strand:+ start:4486 stop:4815 length:330 start_codon:yes stop_codon:yes gene_type:complete